MYKLSDEEEKTVAYYCPKHKKFLNPKRFYHEFDLKLEIEKLMAELECGCSVWVASVERDPVVLDWYDSLEKHGITP